jgi:bacillithiol biosynthesis deacetylase BshB1
MKTVFGSIENVDILAIGVHPDDIELSCSGTLARHRDEGNTIGLLDLTEGELGTRGNAPLRLRESAQAAEILQAEFRVNTGMKDGFFRTNQENIEKIARVIRMSRPKVVLANALEDRHPDHGRAAKLSSEACFYAGLVKIDIDGLAAYRPQAVYHYVQDHYLTPDFCFDVTGYVEKKMESILAFSSQFYDPSSGEPDTPISSMDFLDYVRYRMLVYGRSIGVRYAEAFNAGRTVGVNNLFALH